MKSENSWKTQREVSSWPWYEHRDRRFGVGSYSPEFLEDGQFESNVRDGMNKIQKSTSKIYMYIALSFLTSGLRCAPRHWSLSLIWLANKQIIFTFTESITVCWGFKMTRHFHTWKMKGNALQWWLHLRPDHVDGTAFCLKVEQRPTHRNKSSCGQ